MLIGRCSSQLSGHRKLEKSQPLSVVEGSAVRPGSRTKVSVPLVLPQNRHPACPSLSWNRSEVDRPAVSSPNTLLPSLARNLEQPLDGQVTA
jgi:hypothetical protein